jgi:hypothetical protein
VFAEALPLIHVGHVKFHRGGEVVRHIVRLVEYAIDLTELGSAAPKHPIAPLFQLVGLRRLGLT